MKVYICRKCFGSLNARALGYKEWHPLVGCGTTSQRQITHLVQVW